MWQDERGQSQEVSVRYPLLPRQATAEILLDCR